jgi:hypothetical protein
MYFDPGSITNCTIGTGVAANALTVSLLTQGGATPSASSPCVVSFRNATASTGDYTAVLVTAATTISTATSGSTFGAVNSTAFRLWVTAWNNAGTVVLGLSNQSTSTSVFPITEGVVQSSTACSACGTATAAGTFYTTAAQTSKAVRILGYAEWASGLATAGTFASGPTNVQMMGPGVPRPGTIVQVKYGSSTTLTSTSSTSFVTAALTVAITPTSTVNLVKVNASGILETLGTSGGAGITTIFRGTVGGTDLSTVASAFAGTGVQNITGVSMQAFDLPQTTSSQTYTVGIRTNNGANTATWNETAFGTPTRSTMIAEEIQG